MSKKIQAIIAGSIVIVLLVGAIIALVLTNKSATEGEATSSFAAPELITLIEGAVDELEYIQVKNKKDEYKIESLGEKKWGIKALDGFKQVDGMFDTTASSVVNLYAQEIIEENATDLAKYGFDKPTLVAEIKMKGKDSFKITLGDLSPDTYTRYVIKTGEKNVYGMSSSTLTNLLSSRYDYLDKLIVPALEAGQDGNPVFPELNYVSVKNEFLEKPVVLEPYASGDLSKNGVSEMGLKMTSPVDGMLHSTRLQEKITPLFGLAATNVVAIAPTAEEIAKYGFNEQSPSISFTYDKTFEVELVAGAPIECKHQEGEDLTDHKHSTVSYYVMRKGTEMVYEVAKESVTWLDVKKNTFLSSIAVLPPILDIDGVDFKVGNELYKITYTQGEDKEDTDDMVAAVNGKTVDLDASKKMLQLFYATSIQDVNVDFKPTKAPNASLVYYYSNDKVDKVEFYIMEDRQIVISLNGNMAYIGRAGYVEIMDKNIKRLVAGEKVDTEW